MKQLLRRFTLLFLLYGPSWAQDQSTASVEKPRRLESVSWNSVDHKLTWVISSGEKKSGQPYEIKATETYDIDLDSAVMIFHKERRKFSTKEAESVHVLMDLISKYAVESTIWWDDGQGQRVDEDGKPQDPIPESRPVPTHAPGDRKKIAANHGGKEAGRP